MANPRLLLTKASGLLISCATPAASVPTEIMRSASCRRSSMRLRSVTSAHVPTIRSASPPGPRETTRAFASIQRHSPVEVRTRCSTSRPSRAPRLASSICAPSAGRSSGWTYPRSSLAVLGIRSSG